MKVNALTGNAGQVWEAKDGKLYLVISKSEVMKRIREPYKCICIEVMMDPVYGAYDVKPTSICTMEMNKFAFIRGELDTESLNDVLSAIKTMILPDQPQMPSMPMITPSMIAPPYPAFGSYGGYGTPAMFASMRMNNPYANAGYSPFCSPSDHPYTEAEDLDSSCGCNNEGYESDEDEFDPYAPLPENNDSVETEEDSSEPEYNWNELDEETRKLLCETLKEENPTECAAKFGLNLAQWNAAVKKYTATEKVQVEMPKREPRRTSKDTSKRDLEFLKKNNVPTRLQDLIENVKTGKADPDTYLNLLDKVMQRNAAKYFSTAESTVYNYKKTLRKYKEEMADSKAALNEQAASKEYDPAKVIDTAYGKVLEDAAKVAKESKVG